MNDVPLNDVPLPAPRWLSPAISPHATAAYMARVAPVLCRSHAQARQELIRALGASLFRLDIPGGLLWGCLTEAGFPFLILTASLPPEPLELEPLRLSAPGVLRVRTVGPWWFWREARPLWRQHGVIRKQGAQSRWVVVPVSERKLLCP